MKKVLAVILTVAAGMASGLAQKPTTYVNTATVKTASAKIATAAALTPPLPGSLPMYTSTGGALGNSLVFQSGSNVGINTTSPATTLNLVGANPTMRIDNYSNVAGDSPNFNFLSAHGAAGAPLPTVIGDNLGQFAAAGFNGSAFPGSKVKVSFVATESWTTLANGTAMSFQTTQNLTTGRHERMRIDNTGNVGIGDFSSGAAPANPLSVKGIIQSTTGGFKFPDSSTQITGVPSCALNQIPKWNGTGWGCFTSPAANTLALSGGLSGNLTSNLLTLGTDPTVLQQRVTQLCTSGSAIASINQNGTVNCQTVSGGGVVSFPVNWSDPFVPTPTLQGVLNVTNTANGPAEPQNTPPNSFFATVPAAVVGKSTGTGITGGVAGIGLGSSSVGVFAYTATSHLGAMLAWNGLTGFTGTNDFPKAFSAMLANETGGSVIKAESLSATAPAPCSGSGNCQSLSGVDVNMDAISGVTVGFSANLNSPLSQGLNLNFNSPLAAGTQTSQGGNMINANVNNNGVGPSTYFQVDNNANINTSGGLTTNGPSNLNGQVSINNGLNLTGSLSSNGGASFQNLTISNDLTTNNLNTTNLTVANLNVTGSLSKPQGTFKIDHPLDPANKFLYHSFVESPDMMNIYNGVIVLDKHGKAVVALPDYFEALNQDFRYQLTSIGAPGPNLFVASEIKGNKFIVAGGKPGAKVSWQVTGIRHDAYAEAHRIVVEEDKGKERGTYLHPELFQNDPVLAKK
jgi:hypothetical protein